MDINLFLKSLSQEELRALKRILVVEATNRMTTMEFVNKHHISNRLYNLILPYIGQGGIFEYIDDVDKDRFMRIPYAGRKRWLELELLIDKYRK